MNNKRIVISVLIAMIWIQGAVAIPQFLQAYQTLYTNGSCATCHINPLGGGPRNTYGTSFESMPTFQGMENVSMPNFFNDTITALTAAGPAPGSMPISSTTNVSNVTWFVLAGGQSQDMALQGMGFYPDNITVDVGDTVTWSLGGNMTHTVSFLSGAPAPQPGSPESLMPAGGSTYNGTGIVSSGLLLPGTNYSLTFTKTGIFPYECLIHPGMSGNVIVRSAGNPYPFNQTDYNALGNNQLDKDLHTGTLLVNNLSVNNTPGPNGTTIFNVLMDIPDNQSVMYARFTPKNLTIHVNDQVVWNNIGNVDIHTVTFPIPNSIPEFVLPNLTINPIAAMPAGGNIHNGSGFYNSGILNPGDSYNLTFTKAGTYNYYCLIHDNLGMVGKIHVSSANVSNDTIPPVINSVMLDNTTPNAGEPIMVTVNATDDVGVVEVTANGTQLTSQGGDIWSGSIMAEVGNHAVDVMAFDAAGNTATNDSATYSATPSNITPGMLNITKVSPGSPLMSAFGQVETFMVKLNQHADVEWSLDGSTVQTNNSVNSSKYINTDASIGQHTLMVSASNTNGSDSFSWDWNVTSTVVGGNGSIIGTVFNDKNKDKKKEKGEKGIAGVKVILTNTATKKTKTTVTDSKGNYKFKNLKAGNYTVKLMIKTGFKITTSTTRHASLIPNEVDRINFGIVHK